MRFSPGKAALLRLAMAFSMTACLVPLKPKRTNSPAHQTSTEKKKHQEKQAPSKRAPPGSGTQPNR
ncbi:hypothetical protein Srot_1204 [Segniliparus rotundus DSM 44985]|uniref:Lipoprotein n=1 Tax=Segniliparus rotundus (strain ATCC BAA-972 / CDC 1076 / CIP 108378 / DSM 44985 / JCM 13578) TaxID=640132 RepID=D6ZFF1_SEGRD|nr:hypothetical protein Srot_1204 [Segniliparus rotundus DSM 44985]